MNKYTLKNMCPVEMTVLILANKWTIPIIRELMTGPKRPSDLERTLKGLSAKTLAERLHDLKEWEIITRHSFPEVPPRVEYGLTMLGMELIGVFNALQVYGEYCQSMVKVAGPDPDSGKQEDSAPQHLLEQVGAHATHSF